MHNHLFINALQNLLFCIPKAALLHGKSVGFASQNSRFRNAKSKLPFFKEIIFTKTQLFYEMDAIPQNIIDKKAKEMDINLIMRFSTILPLNKTSPIILNKKMRKTFL